MIITGMAHFESVAQKKLVEWYHKNRPEVQIDRAMYLWFGPVKHSRITSV